MTQAPPTPPRPRVAVIAGATGNVGAGTVKALARRGFQVVMLGRDLDKLRTRAAAIESELRAQTATPPGAIHSVEADLTDLVSLRRATAGIAERFSVIDALILSAVILRQDGPNLLPDGNELMFSTSVLGPFRLARLLTPILKACDGIVVHVVAPFQRKIDWQDLQSITTHKPMIAYERSKTCHRLLAGEMARRHPDTPMSVAFDPGFCINWSDPDLKQRWPKGFTGWFWRVYAALAAKPPEVAGKALADLIEHALKHKDCNGAYFTLTKRRAKPEPAMANTQLGSRLWNELEALAFPDGGSVRT